MRNRPPASLSLAAALGLMGSLVLAGVVMAAPTTLTADLAGDAETAADGTGSASVMLDPETGEACWELSVEGIEPVTQSHIHEGAEGVSGGVVVPLDVDGFEGSSEDCVTGQDAATLQAIIDDPASYYVNIHTETYPAGAIRGQLAASGGTPNTALPTNDSPIVLFGILLLAGAAAIGLRAWRPIVTRD